MLNLDNDKFERNSSLYLPNMRNTGPLSMTLAGTSAADAFSRVDEYEVQPGDSLTQIARKFKASERAIKKVNHMVTKQVIAGEILLIPIP